MKRIAGLLLGVLSSSYLIAVFCLLVCFLLSLIREESVIGTVLSSVGMFSFVMCIYLFMAHLISLLLIVVFKRKS
jgi:hypothetical protein